MEGGLPSEEVRFSTNATRATALVQELITKCYNAGHKQISPFMIGLASAYLANLDKKFLIETFIKHTYQECWEMIRLRQEEFFVNHSDKIFGELPVDKGNIEAFKILFTSKDSNGAYLVPQADRDSIFDIFISMVKICIKYVHRIREPYLTEVNGKMVPRYKNNFYPEIKVLQLAKLWKIELPMPSA